MKQIIITISLLSVLIGCSNEDPVTSNPEVSLVYDIDGNSYHTVTIGTQVWMVENLKTTRYNDSTKIPHVTNNTDWWNLSTPGYCWYMNDSAKYKADYGAMYNWYAVNTGKLAPKGWHVPTDNEWKSLEKYLGMTQAEADDIYTRGSHNEAGKLKEAGTKHWSGPNSGADNSSGFSALPGGYRDDDFDGVGSSGFWWSSTQAHIGGAWIRSVGYLGVGVTRVDQSKRVGCSVRCVKD